MISALISNLERALNSHSSILTLGTVVSHVQDAERKSEVQEFSDVRDKTPGENDYEQQEGSEIMKIDDMLATIQELISGMSTEISVEERVDGEGK